MNFMLTASLYFGQAFRRKRALSPLIAIVFGVGIIDQFERNAVRSVSYKRRKSRCF